MLVNLPKSKRVGMGRYGRFGDDDGGFLPADAGSSSDPMNSGSSSDSVGGNEATWSWSDLGSGLVSLGKDAASAYQTYVAGQNTTASNPGGHATTVINPASGANRSGSMSSSTMLGLAVAAGLAFYLFSKKR